MKGKNEIERDCCKSEIECNVRAWHVVNARCWTEQKLSRVNREFIPSFALPCVVRDAIASQDQTAYRLSRDFNGKRN